MFEFFLITIMALQGWGVIKCLRRAAGERVPYVNLTGKPYERAVNFWTAMFYIVAGVVFIRELLA